MKSGKAPRFFCEHCGAEVGKDERSCPECGRFFSAVRCPRCGFSGAAGKFSAGCPVCGYSLPPGDAGYELPRSRPASGPAAPLPLWTWIVAIAALAAAIAGLFSIL
ncbi:MAG: hypothetical protein CVV47_00135 [Spirochaetae bacterium HGW-Spirochaetae-3]|nr:MAG: hypothetical protein CVV47_00135 [Spirochaetae bacterium HGW-Spirochaetae-3]